MSLKPKKKSDLKKIQKKMEKKRRVQDMDLLPPYTLIVSEGIKTEPFYLNGLVRKINRKYRNLTKQNHIEVYGTGRNTQGLIRFVDQQIQRGTWLEYRRIWLVYDKDDFPLDNFDNTQFEAEARRDVHMSVAWSNESIELWFLLHFQDYTVNNGRRDYIERLNKYIDYSKTREDLYDVITGNGSVSDAKRRARQMYENFMIRGVSSPSKMYPATRMFELIEELEKYL